MSVCQTIRRRRHRRSMLIFPLSRERNGSTTTTGRSESINIPPARERMRRADGWSVGGFRGQAQPTCPAIVPWNGERWVVPNTEAPVSRPLTRAFYFEQLIMNSKWVNSELNNGNIQWLNRSVLNSTEIVWSGYHHWNPSRRLRMSIRDNVISVSCQL